MKVRGTHPLLNQGSIKSPGVHCSLPKSPHFHYSLPELDRTAWVAKHHTTSKTYRCQEAPSNKQPKASRAKASPSTSSVFKSNRKRLRLLQGSTDLAKGLGRGGAF